MACAPSSLILAKHFAPISKALMSANRSQLPIREAHTHYLHQIPIGARAGQNWVAKVLRRGVFERGAVATNELPSRLGRTILGRAFAATWGRLFFG